MKPEFISWIALAIFLIALAHTFSVRFFERLAHHHPKHAGVFHLLGEVEIVFGFWAMVLVLTLALNKGTKEAISYIEGQSYTEPLFVFVVMIVAATKPILDVVRAGVRTLASVLPLPLRVAKTFLCLALLPLLGSLITEPAAMTVAALILRDAIFDKTIGSRLKYLLVGVLFVNVSIGGVLTNYAAPPVLMVADTWNWSSAFMFSNFGWKAALAVAINAALVCAFGYRELASALPRPPDASTPSAPMLSSLLNFSFLASIVLLTHHPVAFMGVFLLFLGVATAYPHHHNRLLIREGLLVGFFLSGLVVLGGLQTWWLQPLLTGMSDTQVFFGAVALTAVTDNAALTYLGSLVQGLSESFKYALVAGAVAGGGLTVIANAPNPAGYALLKGGFDQEEIGPLGLLCAAAIPTLVAILAFKLL
jgi:Putative Na+/H+ antiporter